MGLLSHLFFLHLFVLVFIANAGAQFPVQFFKHGSKTSSIQAPFISNARHQTMKEIQQEITNSWPEGIIIYYLDDTSYDSSIGVRIRTAMSVLEAATCLRFKVQTTKPEGNNSWIHITNPKKKRQCMHETKVVDKGEIMLVLGYDCLQQDELIHSLLHGIGFNDEISHPHRDKYIKVVWDNIQPVYRHLYKIQPVETSRSIVEYDPLSIMHFHDRAFSSNGKATIVPLETGLIISPSDSLSQLDKMKIQLHFGHECNKRKFGSLIETCKKSLKDENEIEPVKHDQSLVEEDISEDKDASVHYTKETENNNQKTEENVEIVNTIENKHSDENDPTKNIENEEGKETLLDNNVTGGDDINVTGETKENPEVTENSEEKTLEHIKKQHGDSENLKEDNMFTNEEEKEKVKLDGEFENHTSSPVTLLTGFSRVPIPMLRVFQ